ncbi:MAG: hypothetical protein PUB67_02900 [Clostridiales bacterium]|nr:hypothetical protein [Clostridiales bacterium]
MKNELDDYSDLINKPYIKSKQYAHMSVSDRAAQFSAFAALTGYEEAIEKTKENAEEKYEHEYE